MAWTEEQKSAIEKKGANILVSAAAGAGKTTVLIGRIINKVINENVDIDKLLVVTFTNAAASEMKERLLKEIYERLDQDPNSENLQKQIGLINNAHISTIHSFCLDVIRNNFFEVGISANFRVADETEIELMKQEIIEEIFENKYEEKNEQFIDLINTYTSYKDDTPLKNIILKMFEFTNSVPYPEDWLNEAVEEYNINEQDFSLTKWGKIIIDNMKKYVADHILNLKQAANLLEGNAELIDFYNVVSKDLEDIKNIDFKNWETAYKTLSQKEWADWPSKRKMEEESKELKEKAKELRDDVKTSYNTKVEKWFPYGSKEAIADINEMYSILLNLKDLVFEFSKKFKKKKLEKNIIDFNDIEHIALNLLVNKDGTKTDIAQKYDFNEILIDEYQDSNMLQEKILQSVSNGKNVFMVGDVKQSIYRFREAKPELFLEKYEKYDLLSTDIEQNVNTLETNTKIQLYKNFRSRENVLDFANLVFQNIMSKDLGEIDYTQEEYLNFAGTFDEPKINCNTEIYVIEQLPEEKDKIFKDRASEENELENKKIQDEESEIVDNATLEARLICKKIKELKEQKVDYKDMAILLRSPSTVAPIIEKELTKEGIPVFTDVASDYLSSIEIDTILSLLKIIDNPLQDIPLVTILRSPIGGFDDNDLIKMRIEKKEGPFYYALKNMADYIKKEDNEINEEIDNEKEINKDKDIELAYKSKRIIEMLEYFKKLEKEIPLNELIWKIYSETGYYYYVRLMPNGKLRQANLRKLFEKSKEYEQISFKGLFNFISFIEKIENKKMSNISEAKIIGQNDDVVRIMSIHKSKGLEFPICFIGGIGKNFNLTDMNEKIIYDQEYGIGVNYVDGQNSYSALTKEAINIKARKEAISEEMRVLYVALTRAKEKLIIVGCDKNALKNYEKKENEIIKYHGKNKPDKINSKLVEKYTRYIDWIELVCQYNKNTNIKFEIVKKEELKSNEENEDKENELVILNREIDKEKYDEVEKLLNWKYSNNEAINLINKTSVTTLKNANIEITPEEIEVLDLQINNTDTSREIEECKELLENKKDNKENSKLTSADKGTLVHLVLQKLNNENIDETIEVLKLNDDEKNYLIKNKDIFEKYVESELFKQLQNAKEIGKEVPFYMNVKYKDNNILMQGVIDLYYVNDKDELILVDYKTDKNIDKNILKERYANQLEMYKLALQKSMNRKVDKTYIYSTFLNELVTI